MSKERDLEKKRKDKFDFVSVIYNQKNDSPKYFEIKKSRILLFVVGLPTLTLIAVIMGAVGLIHTSPFHLIETYKQNSLAREAVAKTEQLEKIAQRAVEDKAVLQKQITDLESQLKTKATESTEAAAEKTIPENIDTSKCPPVPVCPSTVSGTANSIGLSTLSLFKPIQGQRDKTRPATLSLSGFKVAPNHDTVNFQFNIIPSGEGKLSGHIIAVMKTDYSISVYPQAAMAGPSTQINFSSGEPFATQRFRPVDASFLRPRKGGNFIFTVYIFSKTGDLLHYQSVMMKVLL